MSEENLVDYYRRHQFNPVPITEQDQEAWQRLFDRRIHLYQRHLRIPLALLKGRRVIEFGCNSGQNSLLLAAMGARLTLVEPNEQVWPQLREVFRQFRLEDRVEAWRQETLEAFQTPETYDVVIAEGFLSLMVNGMDWLGKISRLLVPGGVAVVSFNDRYGAWLEFIRMMILLRAYELGGITDRYGPQAEALARELFLEDFTRIPTTRPFAAWWKDTLVCPLMRDKYLWDYPGLLEHLRGADCEFYASSPSWSTAENFVWYKNVVTPVQRQDRLVQEWRNHFGYFLTGSAPAVPVPFSPDAEAAVAGMMSRISDYADGRCRAADLIYPGAAAAFLNNSGVAAWQELQAELQTLFTALNSTDVAAWIRTYHQSPRLRQTWGTPYHYAAFLKHSAGMDPV